MKEETPLALANMFQINQSEAMQSAFFQILDNRQYNGLKFGYVSVNDAHSLAAVLVFYFFYYLSSVCCSYQIIKC